MGVRIKRWLLWVAVVLVSLPLLAVAAIYGLSVFKLAGSYEVPLKPGYKLPPPTDMAEGRRQAILANCLVCHGKRGEGQVMVLEGIHRITAPALADVLPAYSDAQLDRLLRHGVRKDGTTALLMPARTFYPMREEDIGQIVGYLRTLPKAAPQERERSLSLKARLGILLDMYPLSALEVKPDQPRWGEQPVTNAAERGRYLASYACGGCHGADFNGDRVIGGPALAIVAAYGFPEFKHLLRTGEPLDKRDMRLMSKVSRESFVHYRDDEIADLYIFLRQQHGLPVDEGALRAGTISEMPAGKTGARVK